MKLAYRIVNVFGKPGDPFSGNPLCVFEDASAIDDATMQALALQFNLSETTFIVPGQAENATARVRIFTPAMELPFAGHPTLGTAHVVRAVRAHGNRVWLQMTAGVIPVSAQGNRWTLQANTPNTRSLDANRYSELASALGVTENMFAAAPLWVDTGMEQLMVPLVSQEVVRAVSPRADLALFGNTFGKVSVYCFSPVTESEVLARFFFAKNAGSITEDPATGSACANLGGYLVSVGVKLPCKRDVLQGAMVGRPSMLGLEVDVAGVIRVSGEVCEFGAGTVEI